MIVAFVWTISPAFVQIVIKFYLNLSLLILNCKNSAWEMLTAIKNVWKILLFVALMSKFHSLNLRFTNFGTGSKYKSILNAMNPTANPMAAAISIFSCGAARPSRSNKYSEVCGHIIAPPSVQFIGRDKNTALCNSVDAYRVCVDLVFSCSHGCSPLNERTVPLASVRHTQNM